MCNNHQRCTAWISLESMGCPVVGCLHSPSWLRTVPVSCSHSLLHPSVYVSCPGETLTCIKTVSHGAFGYIDTGIYETAAGKKEVYIKRPIMPGKNLLYEACMQQLVGERLADIGFQNGAPRVHRVFRLRDGSVGFAMEPIEGACTLDHYLLSVSDACLSNVIVDCLLQLCAMLWHLNHPVGINHRDLTPSNFLVVDHAPMRKILTIENDIIEISSTRSLTLIDFGFSCLGSPETQRADLSLSTVYPASDPCPKEGRDLFLFIGLLYIDYHARFPAQLRELFERWLQDPGAKLCKMMRNDKESSKKWLYFMAGNDQITRFPSHPSRMIQDLQAFLSM